MRESNNLIEYIISLEEEIKFLKERNRDLRQKTWMQVYEENIQLVEENNHLKDVLKSVETFISQFAK
jgi:regulator of replication initiation timing